MFGILCFYSRLLVSVEESSDELKSGKTSDFTSKHRCKTTTTSDIFQIQTINIDIKMNDALADL